MTKEQKSKAPLDIRESMKGCKVLELTRVSDPSLASKHVLICTAGFMTEAIDKREEWQNVQTHYKNAEVYACTWTSCALTNFFDSYNLKKKGKQISAFRKLVNMVNVEESAKRQFYFAQDQARLTGIMLAIFLLKSNFSQGRAISLIGHSLGTVVIFNCLRVLKYFYREGFGHAGRILHDVQCWAGAEVIDAKKTEAERMRKAFHCSVVCGRMFNLYSAKDTALTIAFPRMHPGQETIGVGPIQLDVPEDEEGKLGVKKIHNIDVVEVSPGHTEYKNACVKFLHMLKSSY